MKLRRLEPSVRRALRGPCPVAAGDLVLVAVSGGADSTALLIVLDSLAHEFGYRLHAAHLHHGLRGEEADADLEFVRALCKRLGIPLTDAAWDTRARMRRRGLAGQAGLRTLRREFLLATARRSTADHIATAHTADDQLETVLMRLLRGAGLRGLGAISERRGVWIRPLLAVARADIETDLRRAGQEWREDASNHDLAYTRNRVRHAVVPALVAALGPQASQRPDARARLARRVAEGLSELRSARVALERQARRTVARHARIQAGEIRLDSHVWRSYPPVIQRLALRQAWASLVGHETGLTERHLGALMGLLRAGRTGSETGLPLGARAVRDEQGLRLTRGSVPGVKPSAVGRVAR